jgi:hypothetical protein
MKNILTYIGSTMAAIGISLMAISCGEKESADRGDGDGKNGTSADGGGVTDLEAQMVGYWATDAEAMMAEMKAKTADDPAAALMIPLIQGMIATMSVEVPKKGEVVVHIMGEAKASTYKLTKTDEASKTLTMEVTEDGKVESGTAVIGGDTLTLIKDEDTIILNRIDEAAFTKRLEAAKEAPAGLDLLKGLDIPDPTIPPTPPKTSIPQRNPGTPPPPAPRIPRTPTPSIPSPPSE